MGRIVPFILVLVAVATQALAALQNVNGIEECKNPKQGVKPHLYDFYVLTLHSRGGYCELNSCEKIPAGQKYPHPPLTIKSYTTRLSNGTEGPTSCMDFPFDMKKLEVIKSNLSFHWPSFNPSVTDENLWKDQTEKYASCIQCQQTNRDIDLDKFFEHVLEENERFNVSSIFNKANIVQSYEKPILLQNLEDAFKNSAFKGRIEFYCQGKRNSLDVLQEVRLCISVTPEDYSKCLSTKPTCQTKEVWYLGNSSFTQVPSTIMVIFTILFTYVISKGQ